MLTAHGWMPFLVLAVSSCCATDPQTSHHYPCFTEQSTGTPESQQVPDADEVLLRWEKATSRIRTVRLSFYRTEYNDVFEVEKRSEGFLYFEAPRSGRLDIRGSEIGLDATSSRIGHSGKNYRVTRSEPETFNLREDKLYQIDPATKHYQAVDVPPKWHESTTSECAGGWLDGLAWQLSDPRHWIPFAVQMDADDARRRFEWSVLRRTEEGIFLSARPRAGSLDALNMLEAQFLIPLETYRPAAIKIVADNETVYVFTETRIGREESSRTADAVPADNPLEFDFTGYTGDDLTVPVEPEKKSPD